MSITIIYVRVMHRSTKPVNQEAHEKMSTNLRWILCSVLFLTTTALLGQGFNMGIRAGINQSRFIGDSEVNANESYDFAGGFHFGVNFQWELSPGVAYRSEIIYTQIGSNYNFSSDDAYYLYRSLIINSVGLPNNDTREDWILRNDQKEIDLTHSNSYIQLPQTVHVRMSKKLEVFGGAYLGILLNPSASGILRFGPEIDRNDPSTYHSFEQGLEFDYNSDKVPGTGREQGIFTNTSEAGYNRSLQPRQIIVGDQDVDLPGAIGSRYLYEESEADDVESKFNWIDYGLIGGFSYYLNRGLYLSLRAEYGLSDLTRTAGDRSFQEINEDKTFIYNDDSDRNFNVGLSIGFKF